MRRGRSVWVSSVSTHEENRTRIAGTVGAPAPPGAGSVRFWVRFAGSQPTERTRMQTASSALLVTLMAAACGSGPATRRPPSGAGTGAGPITVVTALYPWPRRPNRSAPATCRSPTWYPPAPTRWPTD